LDSVFDTLQAAFSGALDVVKTTLNIGAYAINAASGCAFDITNAAFDIAFNTINFALNIGAKVSKPTSSGFLNTLNTPLDIAFEAIQIHGRITRSALHAARESCPCCGYATCECRATSDSFANASFADARGAYTGFSDRSA
jgi:hypothetical protein